MISSTNLTKLAQQTDIQTMVIHIICEHVKITEVV